MWNGGAVLALISLCPGLEILEQDIKEALSNNHNALSHAAIAARVVTCYVYIISSQDFVILIW